MPTALGSDGGSAAETWAVHHTVPPGTGRKMNTPCLAKIQLKPSRGSPVGTLPEIPEME